MGIITIYVHTYINFFITKYGTSPYICNILKVCTIQCAYNIILYTHWIVHAFNILRMYGDVPYFVIKKLLYVICLYVVRRYITN